MVVAAAAAVSTTGEVVAHIAGALGKPVWMVLPVVADWRWSLDRDRSAWYPTMRLFRQKQSADWDTPFVAVAEALRRAPPGTI